ncbi:hypothetical protein [Deinococcus multiflagellatus]|uniref:Uncharacterized protein n=1 Tax=Deinococcus multiflagellatus TaxID=1656887 RepID=A0ABW1ZRH8_9DEIO
MQAETVDEDLLRLWRRSGHPSSDEAATVAREVGWLVFDADWESAHGTRYLVVRQRPEVEDDHPDDVPPWEARPRPPAPGCCSRPRSPSPTRTWRCACAGPLSPHPGG